MGYYVYSGNKDLRFKPGLDIDGPVLQAVKDALFDPTFFAANATGGRSPKTGDIYADTWYAWTDTEACRTAASMQDLLGQFLEEVEVMPDGEIQMSYSSKSGNEDVLFKVLAPYLAAGSYCEWRGEEGEHWRWLFDGETMVEQSGFIAYQ